MYFCKKSFLLVFLFTFCLAQNHLKMKEIRIKFDIHIKKENLHQPKLCLKNLKDIS